MRRDHALIALLLIASLSAHAAGQDQSPDAKAAQEPAPQEVANSMASFARMETGQWRMTAESGTSTFDTWHWGPGKHSMRVMTDGSDAGGNPWRELQVMYWHPGRKQVCLLGVSPFARGISEGTIKFEGETANAVFDLHQTGGRRKMGLLWTFDGPDKYHEKLLEATGPAGLAILVEWDHVRSKTSTATSPRAADQTPPPSERLKPLAALVGKTWEAKVDWATEAAFQLHSTFQWIPIADVIYARVLAPSKVGEPRHLLDAYLFHHTGTGVLRCLALSHRGAVYEGDVTVLDGGSLQFDLTCSEGDRVVPHVARCDFEKDGTVRHRAWSVKGGERTLLLDVHHKQIDPK